MAGAGGKGCSLGVWEFDRRETCALPCHSLSFFPSLFLFPMVRAGVFLPLLRPFECSDSCDVLLFRPLYLCSFLSHHEDSIFSQSIESLVLECSSIFPFSLCLPSCFSR